MPVPIRSKPLENRSEKRHAGLTGCPDRFGIRIVGPASQAEYQRIPGPEVGEPVLEIELDPMLLRISQPVSPGEIIDGLAIPALENGRYVFPVVIARRTGEELSSKYE